MCESYSCSSVFEIRDFGGWRRGEEILEMQKGFPWLVLVRDKNVEESKNTGCR